MREKLSHRGPDDQDIYVDPLGNCSLAHTRLAILDLSESGRQPMTSDDDRFTIVFNGEIYNFQELRSELVRTGARFRSASDTEVLLNLYRRHGAACLDLIEGMFAFAIWDTVERSCFLARDPLGIKPLYLWHHGNQLAFASEVRSLLQANLGPCRLSVTGLAEYLLHGSVQEPRTLVEQIEMLPAGHFATWSIGTGSQRPNEVPYWDIDWNFEKTLITSRKEGAELARMALDDSIQRHFVSDVPVGVFLSGGIDSTAVLALATANGHAGIKTFCIGFDDEEFDEGNLAAKTAKHFAADHHRWTMTSTEGIKLVDGFLNHLDQPSNDGFNTYCVSKFAHERGVKVVLSGLGGDELFGGYPSFERVPQLVQLGHQLRWTGTLRKVFSRIGQSSLLPSKARRFASFAGTNMGHSAAYWTMRGFFTPADVMKLIRAYTGSDFSGSINQLLNHPCPEQPCDEEIVSYLELTRYMRNQLLRDSDVMSMANSLELRVPLVDRKLIESLRCITPQLRYASGKRIVLDAVPEIPAWIANQPKRGFRFPFERWVSAQWGDLFAPLGDWSPVPLRHWYQVWVLFTLNHFLLENHIDIDGKLP